MRCRQRRPEVLSSGWAGNSMARVAVRDRKGPVPCSKPALDVELRGFEPLTPSMRTLGGAVAGGRCGKSAADGSLSEPLAVGDVAVFDCCTADQTGRSRIGLPRVLRGKGLPRGRAERALYAPGSAVGLCLPGRGDDPSPTWACLAAIFRRPRTPGCGWSCPCSIRPRCSCPPRRTTPRGFQRSRPG